MNLYHPNNPAHRYEPTREDVLVGRVVDGEATPSDWSELEHLAKGDGALWQRLAQAQRAHARLERAVEDEIVIAELVELPEPPSVLATFRDRWRVWGGWAVAAGLALAWLGAGRGPMLTGSPQVGTPTQGAGLVSPVATTDDYWNKYLETGRKEDRLVREMPTQVIDSRDLGPGKGLEFIVVKQIIERVPATDVRLTRVIVDEHGRQQLVPGDRPANAEELVGHRRPY